MVSIAAGRSLRRVCQAADTASGPAFAQPRHARPSNDRRRGRRRSRAPASVRPTMHSSRFATLPADLVDAVVIQPAHADGIPRCWRRAASGKPTSSRARLPIRSRSRLAPTRPGSWSGPGERPPSNTSTAIRIARLPKDAESIAPMAVAETGRGTFAGRDRRVDARRSPQPAQ